MTTRIYGNWREDIPNHMREKLRDCISDDLITRAWMVVLEMIERRMLGDSLDDLWLSTRAMNCLSHREVWHDNQWVRAPITTIDELAAATDAELLRIPNLGRVTLREIREKLEAFTLDDRLHLDGEIADMEREEA